VNVYAESSAVVRWLLGQARAEEIREILNAAAVVVTSMLTLIESDRALIRGAALNELSGEESGACRLQLNQSALAWTVIPLDEETLNGARRAFPSEPIRTLDAIHLASAITAREALGELVVLSLDTVVRTNARALGFEVLPA
jgi:hypothetical protein